MDGQDLPGAKLASLDPRFQTKRFYHCHHVQVLTMVMMMMMMMLQYLSQRCNDIGTMLEANGVNIEKLRIGSSYFALSLLTDVAVYKNGAIHSILLSDISIWANLVIASLEAGRETGSEMRTALHVQLHH